MVAERRVVFLAFPRVQVLDITGPLEVFSLANYLAVAGGAPPPNRTEVVAAERGPLPTSIGLEIVAQRARREVREELDTLVVPGGLGMRDVQGDGALTDELSVETLAERAAMSPRNFARVFRREAGVTPAVYVERVRVESARRLLECTTLAVDDIAHRCGFGTPETIRRAFARCIGTPPSEYRSRFPAHHVSTD